MKKYENIKNEPYPHIVQENFTGLGNKLETEFPPFDLFGKEVRMDGDLFSEDENFKSFIKTSKLYSKLVNFLTSKELITTLIKSFDDQIQKELDNSELLIDPRNLEITSETLETRSGGSIIGSKIPKIFPRLDIGYAGKGYGVNNGGRGTGYRVNDNIFIQQNKFNSSLDVDNKGITLKVNSVGINGEITSVKDRYIFIFHDHVVTRAFYSEYLKIVYPNSGAVFLTDYTNERPVLNK